ncbi:hypothetical protein FRZ40_27725 [Paraburkholderia azotifigens]|uniref:Uncharacterized protein n=1 Tax=Paraburkholderia azotifigens TaxID=2057004 RepID=A0A5C6VFL0_9BURK|nr:hypothetical protein FRZ40_27725 [Paraburkholderia azotifigens]
MLKSAAIVGLLILPGAFFVLGLACIHPRLRRQIASLSGLSAPLTRAGHAYSGIRARLPLHRGHPARKPRT